jgi:DNA-binding LacI/PurR family transcriptional regulator
MRGLCDLNLRVPQDVSVAGFDDLPFSSTTIPRMTTVRSPIMNIAKEACAMIMKRLNEKCNGENKSENKVSKPNFKDIELVPELVIRESTAPPRSK